MNSVHQKDNEYYRSLRNKCMDFPSSEVAYKEEGEALLNSFPNSLDGVKVYDYQDKYNYKKLDREKIMFHEDPKVSKIYETALMKKMKVLEKLFKSLKDDSYKVDPIDDFGE